MSRHYTAMGEILDMNKLMNAHAHKLALGNASMNARGDIVDKGIVIKTQEQIEEEFKRIKDKQDSQYNEILMNIKDPIMRQQAAALVESSHEFEPKAEDVAQKSSPVLPPVLPVSSGLPHPGMPVIVDNRKRRKIVEAD